MPGMNYHFPSCWSVGTHNLSPQCYRLLPSLWVILQNLTDPISEDTHAGVVEHVENRLVLTRELHSYHLVFLSAARFYT